MLDNNIIYDVKTLPWVAVAFKDTFQRYLWNKKKTKTLSLLEIFTENWQGERSSFSVLHLADENTNQYTLNDL